MDSIVSLFLFLGLAVWEDYCVQRISNLLIFIAFINAVLYQFMQQGAQGITTAISHAGILIFILSPLYFSETLGAGDVKLLGVAAAYLTWQLAFQAFLAGIYLSLIPIFITFIVQKGFFVKKIAMSGPIAGGILLIICKEGCI